MTSQMRCYRTNRLTIDLALDPVGQHGTALKHRLLSESERGHLE
jgi:hypothetical protein